MSRAVQWIQRRRPNIDAPFRLFCAPYAGGPTTAFHTWDAPLAPIEVCTIELPGRGRRRAEPSLTSVEALVYGLADAIASELDRPFALFGHSFGAALCFELARELQHRGARSPACLIVSARRAPHLPDPDASVSALHDADVIAYLRKLGGTPEAALNDRELMEFALPPIKADLGANAAYCSLADTAIDSPIHVLGGRSDPTVTERELAAWAGHTSAAFDLQLFPGGHFFISDARMLVLPALAAILHPHSSCR